MTAPPDIKLLTFADDTTVISPIQGEGASAETDDGGLQERVFVTAVLHRKQQPCIGHGGLQVPESYLDLKTEMIELLG